MRNPSCSMLTCQGESSLLDKENNDGANGSHCSSITFRFAIASAKADYQVKDIELYFFMTYFFPPTFSQLFLNNDIQSTQMYTDVETLLNHCLVQPEWIFSCWWGGLLSHLTTSWMCSTPPKPPSFSKCWCCIMNERPIVFEHKRALRTVWTVLWKAFKKVFCATG